MIASTYIFGDTMGASATTGQSKTLTVGERIQVRRRRNHLPRRVVADLIGRSEEWLRLIETGRLQLDSIRAIVRLAEVLQIEDYRELIDHQLPLYESASRNAEDLVERLTPILIDHPAAPNYLSANDSHVSTETTRWMNEEAERCEVVWTTSQRRYQLLTRELPLLLANARRAYWRNHSPDVRNALIRAYCLTARILSRVGSHELSALAGDRALELARHTDTPQQVAAGSWHWANALLHLHQDRRCWQLALAISRTVEPHEVHSDDAVLYGALQLLATRGLAMSDVNAANHLLARLQHLAESIGDDRTVAGVAFGPHKVATARMDIALSRHDFDGVINAARDVANPDEMVVDGRARYFIALARALAGRKEITSATFSLIQACEACPEDLRYDRDAHLTLRQIIEHDDRLLSAKVAHLADIAGL